MVKKEIHVIVFIKQKTAYERRISDWSSDVCSSDLQSQIALPLDWNAGGANDGPLIVGTSNADAVRYLRHVSTWPVRTAVLTGPHGSGRSLMGRRSEERRVGQGCVSSY